MFQFTVFSSQRRKRVLLIRMLNEIFFFRQKPSQFRHTVSNIRFLVQILDCEGLVRRYGPFQCKWYSEARDRLGGTWVLETSLYVDSKLSHPVNICSIIQSGCHSTLKVWRACPKCILVLQRRGLVQLCWCASRSWTRISGTLPSVYWLRLLLFRVCVDPVSSPTVSTSRQGKMGVNATASRCTIYQKTRVHSYLCWGGHDGIEHAPIFHVTILPEFNYEHQLTLLIYGNNSLVLISSNSRQRHVITIKVFYRDCSIGDLFAVWKNSSYCHSHK